MGAYSEKRVRLGRLCLVLNWFDSGNAVVIALLVLRDRDMQTWVWTRN